MAIEVHSLTMNAEISHWFEQGIYPGGEPWVKFKGMMNLNGQDILILQRIRNMNDLAYLWQVADILRTFHNINLYAFIPYFPGARQDRRIFGDTLGAQAPFTVKMYADVVNALEFEHVWVIDPHSDVTAALLNNATFFSSERALRVGLGESWLKSYDALIAPDAGAAKRTFDLAAALGMDYIQALKHRDPKTGKLAQFSVNSMLVGENLTFLVVDDICDGGGTFAGLADEIHNIKSDVALDLYVTHGIFSGNARNNLKSYRDVYSTNSFGRGSDIGYQIDINKAYLPIIKESIK